MTAGLGTRLDPLTRLVAKAAVPLGDATLVERVLDWLRREGVRDTVLNLHHLPAHDHARRRRRRSSRTPRAVLVGAAGARIGGRTPPRAAAARRRDVLHRQRRHAVRFLAGRMLDAHRSSGADVTLALVPNPAPDHYNGIVLDDDGRVTGWVPKGRAHGSWHFIGVQVARASVFAGLADGVPAETVAGIYQALLVTAGALRGFRPSTAVSRRRHAARLPPGRAVAPGERLAGANTNVVWHGARRRRSDLDALHRGRRRHGAGRIPARHSVLVPAAIARPDDVAKLRDGIAVFPLDKPVHRPEVAKPASPKLEERRRVLQRPAVHCFRA